MRKALLNVFSAGLLAVAAQNDSVQPGYPFRASDASPRVVRLREELARLGPSVVEQFWDEVRRSGAPLVEPLPGTSTHSLVTFVWRGSAEAKNVVVVDGVALGVGGIDPAASKMIRIADTDVWYRTYEVRNDARFTYALSENDPLTSFIAPDRKSNSKPDPLNPRRFLTGQTYLELPDTPAQPWIVPRPPESSGKIENLTLNNRNLWVYTPHASKATGGPYPLVVVLGGLPYMNFSAVPAVLDNLIAEGRIPPVVAVVVGGGNDDLMCSPMYADFLAEQLVPWLRESRGASADPQRIVIAGASLGGLAATYTATKHPNVFGNVLSQSASFWWKPDNEMRGEWLTRHIEMMSRVPVRFFMEVGLMEAAEVQLETNRRMRDTLRAKGYSVQYQEFNGNHTYLHWRGSFGDGIVALLGN